MIMNSWKDQWQGRTRRTLGPNQETGLLGDVGEQEGEQEGTAVVVIQEHLICDFL